MSGIADSTPPSESQNAYKTNGKALILKQAHIGNHDERGRRQHPSESQDAYKTNGKSLILKQTHISIHDERDRRQHPQ
jgi:hypothetical protein